MRQCLSISSLLSVQSCTAEAVITALRGNDSYHRLHVWAWKSGPTWRAHPTACSSPQHKTLNCFATTAAKTPDWNIQYQWQWVHQYVSRKDSNVGMKACGICQIVVLNVWFVKLTVSSAGLASDWSRNRSQVNLALCSVRHYFFCVGFILFPWIFRDVLFSLQIKWCFLRNAKPG